MPRSRSPGAPLSQPPDHVAATAMPACAWIAIADTWCATVSCRSRASCSRSNDRIRSRSRCPCRRAQPEGHPERARRDHHRDGTDDVGDRRRPEQERRQDADGEDPRGCDGRTPGAPAHHGVDEDEEVRGREELGLASHHQAHRRSGREGRHQHPERMGATPEQGRNESDEHSSPEPAPRDLGTEGGLDQRERRQHRDEHPVAPDAPRRSRGRRRRLPERADGARHALRIEGPARLRIGRRYGFAGGPSSRGGG